MTTRCTLFINFENGGLKEFSQCYQGLLSSRSNDRSPVINAIDKKHNGGTNTKDKDNNHAPPNAKNKNHNGGLNAKEKIHNCSPNRKDKNNNNTSRLSTRHHPAKRRLKKDMNTGKNSSPLAARATQVLPHIYLGNASDAANETLLCSCDIRYILNLSSTCPNYFSSNSTYRYKQIKIEDSCRQDIKGVIDEAIGFIDLAKSSNSSVLIHCQGGVSRSPTVIIAYLMQQGNTSLAEAYEFVKTRRPCIAPNLNFMGQLLELEQARTKRTCTADSNNNSNSSSSSPKKSREER